MVGLKERIAVWARWVLAIQVGELNPFGLHVSPIFMVVPLVVAMQVLGTPQKLITQAASIGQVRTSISLLLHAVSIFGAHNCEHSPSPLLAKDVLKISFRQTGGASDKAI